MKTWVVYDSVYGNTETVAEAIAEALAASLPGEVQLQRAGEADSGQLENADLLVLGAPTHGALPSKAAQRLLEGIGPPTRDGARLAALDTRLTWGFLRRHGFAADRITETLSSKGWTPAGEPAGFFVGGLRKGPLKKGEVERASDWAREIAAKDPRSGTGD